MIVLYKCDVEPSRFFKIALIKTFEEETTRIRVHLGFKDKYFG